MHQEKLRKVGTEEDRGRTRAQGRFPFDKCVSNFTVQRDTVRDDVRKAQMANVCLANASLSHCEDKEGGRVALVAQFPQNKHRFQPYSCTCWCYMCVTQGRRDMWAAPKKGKAVDHCLMVLSRQREAVKPSNKNKMHAFPKWWIPAGRRKNNSDTSVHITSAFPLHYVLSLTCVDMSPCSHLGFTRQGSSPVLRLLNEFPALGWPNLCRLLSAPCTIPKSSII